MSSFEDSDDYNSSIKISAALRGWWQRHNKIFSTHWLVGCTAERRLEILQISAPTMPRTSSAARPEQHRSATDLILPEIAEDALTAQGGRLLVMLLARRLAPTELDIFNSDVNFLRSLQAAGRLPKLDQGKLAGLDLPFVVPGEADPEVRALSAKADPAMRQSVLEAIASNQLVQADVWLALRARTDALTDFICSIVSLIEKDLAASARSVPDGVNPIAPDLRALYRAEVALLNLDSQAAEADAAKKAATAAVREAGETVERVQATEEEAAAAAAAAAAGGGGP